LCNFRANLQAIDTANRLKADMMSIRTHDLSDTSSSVCDEDLILNKADTLCNFRANLQGGKVQISPVGASGRTLSCVSASLLGWWKQIDRMHFHAK
jgi:hypothetical protein